MKIAITVPGLSIPHGGIRVIVEWANRLSVDNEVTLFCRKGCQYPAWIDIAPSVKMTADAKSLKNKDLLIICSPHDIDLVHNQHAPKRIFIFLQMLEHLFCPGDTAWAEKCNRTYGCGYPTFLISKWNQEWIERTFRGYHGSLYYIGNGVNFDDFPLEPDCQKDGKTVLVEGWQPGNPTKDIEGIAQKVALRLKQEGYRILAYSQLPIEKVSVTPHEYYMRPSRERLNDLYRRASVLIKASKYDARACAPMEAMTKGTVTVRSLHLGDDDLIPDVNCLRVGYPDEEGLYRATKRLLLDQEYRQALGRNCINYVKKFSWDYWMPQIERILQNA